MTRSRINAIIVDDHLLFSEGLLLILKEFKDPEVEVVHVSQSGEDIRPWFHRRKIHLVLLDLNLGEINGIDLIGPIKEWSPESRIIILSGYADGRFVKSAFLNGADGYVLKGSPVSDLQKGIEEVLSDNTYMGKGVQVTTVSPIKKEARLNKQMDAYALLNVLTKREQQILKLISQAHSNKEIARALFISDQTVSVHRKNIMKKLEVTNTVGLVKAAQSLSLCD